jgi:hypothetical protein
MGVALARPVNDTRVVARMTGQSIFEIEDVSLMEASSWLAMVEEPAAMTLSLS